MRGVDLLISGVLPATPFPGRHDRQLFIVCAASGTGKTSLVKKLLQADPGIKLSVSTPRASRGRAKSMGAVLISCRHKV
jgi:hypothetical protein